MTTEKQKIELRISEIRSKLLELHPVEKPTDEQLNEQAALQTEFKGLEVRHRSAILSEGEEEQRARGEFGGGDGEPAEMRALLERASLAEYLSATPGKLDGAAAELNKALGIEARTEGHTPIPWYMLETAEQRQAEQRVDVATTTTTYAGGVMQRPILERLFGGNVYETLGVRMDSVPSGRTDWPLITGGVSPAQTSEGTAAADSVSATITNEVLKPKKLTGRYYWTHESSIQVPDLEAALRRDLADATRSQMYRLSLTGNESTNPEQPNGFYEQLTAPTAPTAVSTYSDYAGAPAMGVDGIHAELETDCSLLIGTASYQHAAKVFQSGSGESATEALKRRARRCQTSPYVPAPVSNVQDGNIVHSGGMNGGKMRGDSVAAVWPALEVIRDIYSRASEGVLLTYVMFWDLRAAFRSAAYQRIPFQVV